MPDTQSWDALPEPSFALVTSACPTWQFAQMHSWALTQLMRAPMRLQSCWCGLTHSAQHPAVCRACLVSWAPIDGYPAQRILGLLEDRFVRQAQAHSRAHTRLQSLCTDS